MRLRLTRSTSALQAAILLVAPLTLIANVQNQLIATKWASNAADTGELTNPHTDCTARRAAFEPDRGPLAPGSLTRSTTKPARPALLPPHNRVTPDL